MRRTLIACLVLTLATPVLASEKPKEEGGPVGQYVDITPLALPVIANGTVKNFIYMRVRVNLGAGVDATKARDKEPYLRDALIRAGYKTPFTRGDTWLKLDEAKLASVMTHQATAILGPRKVTSVTVMSQDPQRISNVGRPS